jgi:hypothetical protein
MRILVGLLALSAVISAQAPEGKAMLQPPLPYVDKGACPFEGCAYREWTALKDANLYDSWNTARKSVGTLHKGEKVTALGGVVITYRPGLIRLDRDYDALLKKGDTLLTYTYIGEGFAQVWTKGRFYDEFDISFTKWPDGSGCGNAHCAATYVDLGLNEWWVELKRPKGTAWVNMASAQFDGMDQLAADQR